MDHHHETLSGDGPAKKTLDQSAAPLESPAEPECDVLPGAEIPATQVQIVHLQEQLQNLRRDMREEWIKFGEAVHSGEGAPTRRGGLLAGMALVCCAALAAMWLAPRPWAAASMPEQQVDETELRVEAALQAGLALREAGDLRGAVQSFAAGLAREPGAGRLWLERGRTRFFMEDFGGAEADLNQAVELTPAAVDPLVWRGNARQRQYDYSGAIADFTRVIELAPESDVGYYNRALAAYEQRRFDAAIVDASSALKLNPEDAANFALRAKAYLANGSLTSALADLDEAIRRDERDAGSRFYRGVVQVEAGRLAEGLADLAAAIDRDPAQTARLARKYRRAGATSTTAAR